MNWQTFETLGLSFGQRTTRRSTWVGLPLLIGVAAPALADPIIPGPSTTVISEPVREDGTIDYAAAINEQGLSREGDNALLLIDRHFHYDHDDESEMTQRRAMYAALGLEMPPNPETPQYPSRRPEGFQSAWNNAWTAEEWPELNQWLNEREAMADRFVETSRAPFYFAPTTSDVLIYAHNPNLYKIRATTQLILLRVNRSLAAGDPTAAWHDLMGIYRWSYLLARDYRFVLSIAFARHMTSFANPILREILIHPETDLELLRQIEGDLASLPEPAACRDLQDERYTVLDSATQMMSGRLDGQWYLDLTSAMNSVMELPDFPRNGAVETALNAPRGAWATQPFEFVSELDQVDGPVAARSMVDLEGFDPNRVLRRINAHFDWLNALAEGENWRQVQGQFELWRELNDLDEETYQAHRLRLASILDQPTPADVDFLNEAFGRLMAHTFLGTYEFLLRDEFRQRAEHRMLRIAVAINIHHQTHGQLPVALTDLLETSPDLNLIDPFGDGATFRYVVEEDQTSYILYSLNVNLQDDGGRSYLDADHNADEARNRTPSARDWDIVVKWQAPAREP